MYTPVSFDAFVEISAVLTQDVADSTGPAMTGQPARERRNYVRAVFAFIEGHVWGIKQISYEFSRNSTVFSAAELAMLLEQAPDLSDNGSVTTRATKIPLRRNIRFAFLALARVFGTEHVFDVDSEGWKALVAAIKIRDRLMHPKTVADLTVTREEFAIVQAGYAHFRTQQSDAIGLVGVVIARELAKRTPST